ncbi:uncharacterized protein LOC116108784 [Pistacia vera]|uniref:uncharacterized protein LOC116108784 n=1 Tax=Pistacia vera TaxID=55513 RepID=UPI001263121D|nr:uncharacterized protein LOC116108784 [Pistacia vera]
MADQTNTHPFYSHSRSSPSEPRGDEKEVGDGNEYHQFEDTMLLDSPLVQTQLEKLNFDTQVVDDSDCNKDMILHSEHEKEVVLDSEDEGVCTSKTVRVSNGLSDGNKGCGVHVERSDEQKELPQLFTCDSGDVEYEESSQANALEFVDQFLSSKKMEFEFAPGLDIKKTVREKSPRLSSAKGPQILAKRMNFRAASIAKIETFQWADSDQHVEDDVFSERTETPFEFGGFRQRSVTRRNKPRHLNSKEGNISGNKIEQKKEILNLHKEIAFSTYSDSMFIEHGPKETCRVEEVSKLNLENNCVKGFNKEMHGESSEQELDAPDIFNVGFNTQIAAEAMEALSNGPSAGCIASDAYQDPLNITDDSLKGLTTRKGRAEQISLPKTDSCYLRATERKPTQRKRSSRKSGKKSTDQELGPELAIMRNMKRGKLLIGEHFKSRNSANSNESPGRRPTLMEQRQEDEIVGRNNNGETYQGSTISVERISLSKVQATEELKTSSCVDPETRPSSAGDMLRRTYHQSDNPGQKTDDGILKYRRKRSRLVVDPTRGERISLSKGQGEEELKTSSCVDQENRPSSAGDILKRTYHQSDNPGQKTDDGILKYRRKRSRLVADPTKFVSGRERCPTFYADSSAEARDSNLSKKEESCKELCASTSCMKLVTWSHPKGKKALRKVRSHSKSNDISVPLRTLGGNVHKSYCNKSERIMEDNHKTSSYNRGTKETFRGDHDRKMAFMQSSEVNEMDFGLFSNGVQKNREFGVSPNKNLELSSSGYTTTNRTNLMNVARSNCFSSKYHKRPFSKNLPKSSLLKELIKLGVPESIPDFTWKELRRRKDTAHVRVLFSQHLDDSVIKHQKKISARLGISTATCPMDATHFIANRFW